MSDISSKSAQRSAFSVRDICYSGLFAAVISIMAQISIPMPGGVPMTMQTFAITLAAVVLGAKLSTVSSVIYLLLGAVGVPVLANFSGGFDKFIGPTGGFLISFPLMDIFFTASISSSMCSAGNLTPISSSFPSTAWDPDSFPTTRRLFAPTTSGRNGS